jgi:UPF0716 family protein affecting phage T7 exclusion
MLPVAIPGGMEIGVILLLFVLPLLAVIGVLLLARDLFGRRRVDESRFADLERRVRELEQEIERGDGDSE